MSRSATAEGRIRVHIHNNPEAAPTIHITRPLVDTALAGRPDLAASIEVTLGADPTSLAAGLAGAEVLCAGGFDAKGLAARAPRLRWIQSTNAGVERLVPYIPAGVMLTNASGLHAPKGGEYAMTALLMLNHRVPQYIAAKEARRWELAHATPIAGKTVLMVGIGAIGTAAARLARHFGMRVLGLAHAPRRHRLFERVWGPEGLKEVLPLADFVVVTLPLTSETRGMIGAAELDLLPRHAGIVNLGRGAVIDNDALAQKLHEGGLAGAVLDVFPTEPLPADSPLWTAPRLIMSPHCAVDDALSYGSRALEIFLDNLGRYRAGRKLRNLVDPARGY